MDKATDILKIRYAVRFFDFDVMCYHSRYVYELYPDGKVTYGLYEMGTRKAIENNETHQATADDYRKLCAELNACIASADRRTWYIDDSSAEVKIIRPFSRVETMDRGYGNKDTDVGRIIEDYIFKKAGMEWERC